MVPNRKPQHVLVFLLCTLLMLCGCTSSTVEDSGEGIPKPESPILSDDSLRAILLDSWVSDGQSGYFIDGAWDEASSPFSIYDTWWNIVELERRGGSLSSLQAGSVERWIVSAAAGQKRASELPPIAQISYAVKISEKIGIEIDPVRIEQGLRSLYRDGMYAASKDSEANWGSTSLAVEVLATVDLPVPPSVVDNIRMVIEQPVVDRKSAVSVLLPALEAAVALGPDMLSARIEEERLSQIDGVLGRHRDPAWLGAKAALSRIAKNLHGEIRPLSDEDCTEIINPAGFVQFEPGRPSDAQLNFYAASLGCKVKGASTPPHSPAGWPSPTAVATSIRATIAGLRLAEMLDLPLEGYQRLVSKTFDTEWLPAYQAQPREPSFTSSLAEMRLRLLLSIVGHGRQALIEAAVEGPPSSYNDDVSRLVLGLSKMHRSEEPGFPLAEPESDAEPSSIFGAAIEEIRFRAGLSEDSHTVALEAIERLRLPDGTYRMGLGAESAEASMTASALALWISGVKWDPETWATLGFCSPAGCRELSLDTKAEKKLSLTVLALYRSCQVPGCGGFFPLVI